MEIHFVDSTCNVRNNGGGKGSQDEDKIESQIIAQGQVSIVL